jgi:hypothetical protein
MSARVVDLYARRIRYLESVLRWITQSSFANDVVKDEAEKGLKGGTP